MRDAAVSRETEEMLRAYAALLLKWTRRINLIAPSTEAHVWERHILDCVQAVQCLPKPTGRWVDIGAGGGLPGIVAAIVHRDSLAGCTLIESDGRKCAFLRSAARELGLDVDVRAERVEQVRIDPPDVLSARALAPLETLFDLTAAHHGGDGTFLFMKGRSWRDEVETARRRYRFSLETRPSVTDTESATLLISNIERLTHGPDAEPQDHVHRQSEGRGRQDDHGDQSRRGAGGERAVGARGRS